MYLKFLLFRIVRKKKLIESVIVYFEVKEILQCSI